MLTREDIVAIIEHDGIEAIIDLVLVQQQQIAQLQQQVQLLLERLGLNSQNSSKPPSSDPPSGGLTRIERRKSQRKSGGQKGHRGHTLRQVETPDEVVVHAPAQCEACSADLSQQPLHESSERRQVFDLPERMLQVCEHRRGDRRCRCGHLNRGSFPEQVRAPAQYGPRLLATAAAMTLGHHLPLRRTSELLGELIGQTIAEATLIESVARIDARIDPAIEAIIDGLLAAGQLHVDETSSRVESGMHWLHVHSSRDLVYYAIDAKRGREAAERIGLLGRYRGRMMSDFFAGYLHYSECRHGFCCAHLLRELMRFVERDERDDPEESIRRWAGQLFDVLHYAIGEQSRAREAGLAEVPPSEQRYIGRCYQLWVNRGLRAFPAAERGANTMEHNLLRRLDEHRHEILSFLADTKLEATNNRAERDLRMMKLQQKISGGFRTLVAAVRFARVRSYLATARKQGVGFIQAALRALEGRPVMPVLVGVAE